MSTPDGVDMKALTALVLTLLLPSAIEAAPGIPSSAEVAVVAPSGVVVTPVSTGLTTSTVVVDGHEHESEIVAWAVDRFLEAGLHLPPATVEFTTNAARCDDHGAVVVHGTDQPRIVVCASEGGTADVVVKRIVLHELAHVWTKALLRPDVRSALMVSAGLREWSSGPWSERGSEYAAEIIMWGLMDRDLPLFTIGRPQRSSLEAWFTLLTGSTPLDRER